MSSRHGKNTPKTCLTLCNETTVHYFVSSVFKLELKDGNDDDDDCIMMSMLPMNRFNKINKKKMIMKRL